jgi:dTDP-4-dehydrorhamnose reductase
MKIVVTGKTGQVVQALREKGQERGLAIECLGRPELDLVNADNILVALSVASPDIVVAAAAYTAVDAAESDIATAFAVNAAGAKAVAEAAGKLSIPLIHISTDYVFSGRQSRPYIETDPTEPLSVYGRSKLEGERAVIAATADHVILRTAWVYSPFGSNFVKTMLRLAETRDHIRVVADQCGRPTSALDIASAVIDIAARLKRERDTELRGIFHLTGDGEATWAEFAEQIFQSFEKKTGRVVHVERIPTSDYPTPAVRPMNSRLDTSKIAETFGIHLPHWRASLETVLSRLVVPLK